MKIFLITKKIYNFLYFFKYRLIGFGNLFKQKKEIKNLERTKKEVCLIYDFKTSPLAVGNFAYLVLFARYLCFKGFKIHFYIIKNDKISGQSKKEIKKKKYIFNYINLLPKILLNKNLKSFQILKWEEAIYKIKKQKLHVLFKDIAYQRKYSVPSFLFYLFNKLIIKENLFFLNKFLLNENTFKDFSNKKIINFTKKNYLSVLFRMDKFNPLRNSKKDEITKICDCLKKKFPKKNILIISDESGCQKAKKIFKNKKNIFFSKDYSRSVFSDIYLQLKSDICFASHLSGGMLTWHFFSKKKFCCTHNMGVRDILRYRVYYKKNQNHSWWHKKQLFLNSSKLDDLLNLIKKTN